MNEGQSKLAAKVWGRYAQEWSGVAASYPSVDMDKVLPPSPTPANNHYVPCPAASRAQNFAGWLNYCCPCRGAVTPEYQPFFAMLDFSKEEEVRNIGSPCAAAVMRNELRIVATFGYGAAISTAKRQDARWLEDGMMFISFRFGVSLYRRALLCRSGR